MKSRRIMGRKRGNGRMMRREELLNASVIFFDICNTIKGQIKFSFVYNMLYND